MFGDCVVILAIDLDLWELHLLDELRQDDGLGEDSTAVWQLLNNPDLDDLARHG